MMDLSKTDLAYLAALAQPVDAAEPALTAAIAAAVKDPTPEAVAQAQAAYNEFAARKPARAAMIEDGIAGRQVRRTGW